MKFDTKRIVDFAIKGVDAFINDNPTLEFYAFAFDCNTDYAEINLCFNTEEAFSNTLSNYQMGNNSEFYKKKENIRELKYNTGDWEFQCFDTLYVFDEDELTSISNNLNLNGGQDNGQAWNTFKEKMFESFTSALIQFSETETFKRIPKTDDFRFYCIDHDEDVEDALKRMAY